ncbi:hypothetical protein L9F63_012387, partial [Diploptera punctata]
PISSIAQDTLETYFEIRTNLTPLEIMSSLIAAVTHDLDHPGVNQPFLIATSNHLAALYENTSVLENHHWRSAIGCLLESNIAEQLGSCRGELEQQISSLILATDITRQQEFLTRFKRYLDQNLLDMHRMDDRHFILQIALKCADISNPCRPWDISRKWSQKVCEEFFRQGDYERQLNLPVTSLCDRQSTSIPKIQAGFFKYVVSPLFEEWHRFLGTELSTMMMGHLHGNQSRWEALVQHEIAEETRTEISEAEVLDEEVESSSRRQSLPSHNDETDSSQRVGRRHSVPLSMPRPLPLTRTIIRRESLPVGEHRIQRRYPSGPILHLEEEEDIQLGQSSLSLLSACSSEAQHSSGASAHNNRPVSAENLLPEPSIASITTSLEASRLSSVLHGAGNGSSTIAIPSRYLTRQQTFPPLQPYVRVRYMSTTVEMSSCSEVLTEATSHSNSSSSSTTEHTLPRHMVDESSELAEEPKCSKNGCGTPNDSWNPQQFSHHMEKENVDPRCIGSDAELDATFTKTGCLRRNNSQVDFCSLCWLPNQFFFSQEFFQFFGRLYQIPLLRIYRKHDRSLQVSILSYDLKLPHQCTVYEYIHESAQCAPVFVSMLRDQVVAELQKTIQDNTKKSPCWLKFSKQEKVERKWGHCSRGPNEVSLSPATRKQLLTQGLTRRRGSAPVGLTNRSDDGSIPISLALRGGGDRFPRRGSVPIDVTRQSRRCSHFSVLRPYGFKENTVCLPPHCMSRRSSLPYDTTTLSSLLDPLTVPA